MKDILNSHHESVSSSKYYNWDTAEESHKKIILSEAKTNKNDESVSFSVSGNFGFGRYSL